MKLILLLHIKQQTKEQVVTYQNVSVYVVSASFYSSNSLYSIYREKLVFQTFFLKNRKIVLSAIKKGINLF